MAVAFHLGSIPYGLLFMDWGFPVLGWITSVGTGLYLAPLWLNRRGLYAAARVVLPMAVVAMMGTICLWFGRECQAHLALFMVLCCPLQLFDVRTEWKPLAVPILACLGMFLLVQTDTLPSPTPSSMLQVSMPIG